MLILINKQVVSESALHILITDFNISNPRVQNSSCKDNRIYLSKRGKLWNDHSNTRVYDMSLHL